MAPSSTKGAVTRLLRNAAINVTVFQFPCSTFWTSRSPCGARPYRRVIVVDTLVSSMNTSLLGSSLFCRRCNALRAAATSGRSCSAARKLFFKGQLQMMQKPRDRRLSDRDLFLRQSIFEFGQRDVRLLRYQLPHQILVRRQREIFIAAEFGRVDAARLPVKLEEADDRADADPALLRGFRDRGPALDRLDHTPTQIRRIWLRHSCRPPPSRKLESYSRRYGNPRFSLSGKRSNHHPSVLKMHKRGASFGSHELYNGPDKTGPGEVPNIAGTTPFPLGPPGDAAQKNRCLKNVPPTKDPTPSLKSKSYSCTSIMWNVRPVGGSNMLVY